MEKFEKERRFVERRACGVSYSKIASEIGVSKSTLISWSKKMAAEINNLRAVELERLREEFLVCKEHRIKVLGTQLGQVMEEILNRDLSGVSTHRLFEIQARLGRELAVECDDEMVFVRERQAGGVEAMKELLKKTDEWKG